MDFDPRITSDGEGTHYGVEYGWNCNFYFGYGHDVIDEDAQMEKCCVQALRLLIAKADAEIHDLEDELAILQWQLKWPESYEQRDPYEVCCAAFKRKINSLTSTNQSLRNRNVPSKDALDEALEIQGTPERIYDIINALIRDKFPEPDEQVESFGKDLVINLGSLNIGLDLKKQSMETSMDSVEQQIVLEIQEMPELTISEESSSDAARYATKDSKEGRGKGKSDVEVTKIAELDAYRCTAEGKSEFFTLKPVMTGTHLQDSASEGNPKLDALGPGEEKCMNGSKIDESRSSPLSAEVMVKVENDDFYKDIQQAVVDSASMLQDHDRDDPAEDRLKVIGNQTHSIVDAHFTYSSSPNLILKPQGQKVQRNLQSNFATIKPSVPSLTVEPFSQIGERKSLSNAENSGQSGIPSPKVDWRFPFLQETLRQRNVGVNEDNVHANTSRVLGAKRRHIQEAEREYADIQSPLEKVSKGEALDVRGGLASKSLNGPEMCSGSPPLAEAKGSVPACGSASTRAVGSMGTTVEDPQIAAYLEKLKLNLSQDPNFLKHLKVAELRDITKQLKLRRCSKLKKEKIIEEVTKHLASA